MWLRSRRRRSIASGVSCHSRPLSPPVTTAFSLPPASSMPSSPFRVWNFWKFRTLTRNRRRTRSRPRGVMASQVGCLSVGSSELSSPAFTVRFGAMARRWRGSSRREAHQSASIAMRWVFPVPVAAFSAIRGMPSFHFAFVLLRRAWIAAHVSRSLAGPASSSQITVSAASSWHQNGRIGMPSGGEDQWSSSFRVVPETPGQLLSRHSSSSSRSSLMVRCGSTRAAGSASTRSVSAARGRSACCPLRSFDVGPGPGTSMRGRLGRRPRSLMSSVRPRASRRQWLVGAS